MIGELENVKNLIFREFSDGQTPTDSGMKKIFNRLNEIYLNLEKKIEASKFSPEVEKLISFHEEHFRTVNGPITSAYHTVKPRK